MRSALTRDLTGRAVFRVDRLAFFIIESRKNFLPAICENSIHTERFESL
jgi:hypothetical protein